MQTNINNPVALVTGGARRIGAQVARALHDQGMRVIIHYRESATDAHAIQAELNQRRPNSVFLVEGDLADGERIVPLLTQAVDRLGRLDVLVNNASQYFPTPLGSVTQTHWRQLMATNVKAPFFVSQALADRLRARQGSIVNITDIYGERPLASHSVYSMSKAALIMMTRSLALELAPDVRVNAISPGAILWPDDGVDDAYRQRVLDQTPLKRTGRPEDIADAVVYLSLHAEFVTGQVLSVDGGRSLSL